MFNLNLVFFVSPFLTETLFLLSAFLFTEFLLGFVGLLFLGRIKFVFNKSKKRLIANLYFCVESVFLRKKELKYFLLLILMKVCF